MRYEGQKIRRFRVKLFCKVNACHIDSWIHFAMRRDVEELELYLSAEAHPEFDATNHYSLPRSLLDCGALRVLKLGSCVLNLPPASFCFRSLTELHLCDVVLNDLDTSGCPLLENLIIEGCRHIHNLHAPNKKLRYLKIEEYEEEPEKSYGLTLYAPYLQFLDYIGGLRRFYNFASLSSIISASLVLSSLDEYESDSQTLVELLNHLGHARTLKLCNNCVEVLSFGERANLKTPLSATCLELETTLNKSERMGIALLLTSFHCLETLIMIIPQYCISLLSFQQYPESFDEIRSWELLELALSADLQLKTVILHDFLGMKGSCEREPGLEIKLVGLLLKHCKMLDKIIINASKARVPKPELLLSLTKKLLVFPRASLNAEIHFS